MANDLVKTSIEEQKELIKSLYCICGHQYA